MKHFVGLDVSMKETAVCVVDDAGQRIWEGCVTSSADAIAAIIWEKAPDLVRAGMETGPQAVWLWHSLRERGIAVDCIHARRAAAALKLQANKTDRNDAFGLARLVHSGWYEPVAIKSFDRYRMRAVLTARERIVRMSTMMINQIRGLAKTFGLALSAGKGQVFEQSVRRALPDDDVLRDLFECLLSVLSGLKDQRRAFDRQLARFAREDVTCRLLTSAPGLGSLTAIAFVTTVDDPARFRSASDVGPYLGLTPKRYQSGEVDIGGRISKAGDRLTRKLLFEAATVLLFRASPSIALKQWGLRLNARSGSWKARVALARKLAVILLTMWKTNTVFENRSLAA
ncbi:IS110 family transposase [Pelagivirga sediminicola]|uniref:IS110 family transposase n=1 Tax=Pelagivirga sediminicola TaxID=2170575 RepID=A0A2T7G323_9RHOB|nr:IS110 family transposase [Pelagivirga sediminicola]PVA08800.1 IS110 family transposase [Pelagivirga sediminicola]